MLSYTDKHKTEFQAMGDRALHAVWQHDLKECII